MITFNLFSSVCVHFIVWCSGGTRPVDLAAVAAHNVDDLFVVVVLLVAFKLVTLNPEMFRQSSHF